MFLWFLVVWIGERGGGCACQVVGTMRDGGLMMCDGNRACGGEEEYETKKRKKRKNNGSGNGGWGGLPIGE